MLSGLGLVISALSYPALAEVRPQGASTFCRQRQVEAYTSVAQGFLARCRWPISQKPLPLYFPLKLIPATILGTQLELAKSWASIPGTNENPAGLRVGPIVWGMPQRVPDGDEAGKEELPEEEMQRPEQQGTAHKYLKQVSAARPLLRMKNEE